MHDVPYFDRFAPLYDLLLPETDPKPLENGLGRATGLIEQIVDLGGGTGRAARAIAPETVIFDASQPMLTQADSNGYPTVQGDVRSLPLTSESVDAVLSVDAIHHLPALETVAEEVNRVLRPGGVIVIRDFDPTTVRGRGLAFAEHLVGFESTFFSAPRLAQILEDAGLEAKVLDLGFVYTVVGKKTA
ncbi:class I SAM-dependent methyltransferase [Halodesulfurarchaeum sp.]|uniref:class I SAM-dependent methyltransferase n=1 Tax=Halodesulfurarchaeum sp. TaxID=1980530 RepID=UPI002FC2AD2D